MKDFRKVIYLFFIPQFLFLACKSGNRSLSDNQDSSKIKIQSLTTNVINQNAISPFKEVDSLVKLLNNNFALSEVKQVDSVCLKGDGELSEYFWEISVDLFKKNLKGFSKYFLENPGSCLKEK